MYLKPRHLAKLLQTCSFLNMLLGNNNEYWTRVAAHLVWRKHVGLVTCQDVDYGQDAVPSRFFDMVNLPHGYRLAMDQFIALISKALGQVYDYDEDDPPSDTVNPLGWHQFADAPLDVQVRVGMQTFNKWGEQEGYDSKNDILLGMRGIATKIAVYHSKCKSSVKTGQAHELHMGMVRYINEMDDDNTIPISTKQRLMKGFVQAISPVEPDHHGPHYRLLPAEHIRDFALIMSAV
jgi:hypothetical protein